MEQERDKKLKRFTLHFGFTGLFLGSLFTTIVLAWIFVLGVLVGSGNIPNPFDVPSINNLFWKEVPKVTPRIINPQEAPQDQNLQKEDPEIKLQFFQNLETKKIWIPNIMSSETAKAKEQTGSYTVQLASFRDKEKAALFLKQVSQKNIKAYISPGKSKDIEWYRIRTGTYGTLADARKAADQMKDDHRIDAMVVKLE
jgi:hypothetical protein